MILLQRLQIMLHQCNKLLYIYMMLTFTKLISASGQSYHSSITKQASNSEKSWEQQEQNNNLKYFSDEYVEKLRHVFRFLELKGTPLGTILQYNINPYSFDFIEDVEFYNAEDIFEKYFTTNVQQDLESQTFNDEMHNYINYDNEDRNNYYENDMYKSNKKHSAKRSSVKLQQIGEYEGCKRDYGALAEPITNAIIKRALRRILENIYADVTSQDEFCAQSCDFVCDLELEIIPPVGCNLACELVCTTIEVPDNITKYDVIDILLDTVIPHIESQPWTRKMVDSLAKVPSGISDGQLMWTGAWDMCNDMGLIHNNYSWSNLNNTIREQRQFHAKACRLPFQPRLLQNRSIQLYGYIGVCIPDTCTAEHIWTYLYEDNVFFRILLNRILKFDLFTEEIYCGHDNDLASDPAMQCCMAICSLLGALVFVATGYDCFVRARIKRMDLRSDSQEMTDIGGVDNKEGSHKHVLSRSISTTSSGEGMSGTLSHSISQTSTQSLLLDSHYENIKLMQAPSALERVEVLFVGFSAYSTIKRVFTIHRPDGYLACIDFIRFLTFGWVTFAHTWIYGPLVNELWETANLRSSLLYYPRQFLFQAVINFHYAGDTFFLISGLMVGYHWLRRYSGTDERMTWKSVLYFYARKYWTPDKKIHNVDAYNSLVPCMMLVLMIYTTAYKYIVNGPLTPSNVSDADHCRDMWWTCLLLVQNFVPLDSTCLVWTWYMACVFQLHLMAPIILIPLVLKRVAGYAVLAVIYSVHIISTAYIASTAYDTDSFTDRVDIWFTDYLVKPWCRAGPYLIGIILADFLHNTKLKYHMPTWQKLLGWLVAIVCLVCPVYGTYTQVGDNAHLWSKAEQVSYDTLARSGWAIGVAWIIISCATDNAGYFGDWLNHNMYQPLARILYPSYLIHPLLLFVHVFGDRVVIYITWMKMVHLALANICLSLFFGLLFFGLLVHYPISIGFQRVFLMKTKLDCILAGVHKT